MDIYTVLQWLHVAVALLLLLAPGYRTTGLLLGGASLMYMYSIEPDIIAPFSAIESQWPYVYITYLITDMMFALTHYATGGKGSVIQSKILFWVAMVHGCGYLELAGYGPLYHTLQLIGFDVGNYFLRVVYTPAVIVVNILQIAFLIRGVTDAVRVLKSSGIRGVSYDHLRNWGREMLEENPS